MFKTTQDPASFSYKMIGDLASKRVILRACLNVQVDYEGRILDATRLQEALPLIRELALNAKNLIVLGHLGRPEQREKKSSFWKVAEELNTQLKNDNIFVKLLDDLTPENIASVKGNDFTTSRTIFLLQNIRFYAAEDAKEDAERLDFARDLAHLGDTFINNAFADYRKAASTYDLATLLPSYLGQEFLNEVEALAKFSNPAKPFVAVLGGAKLSEKLDALQALAESADKILIGGAMAYTLLKAKGIPVGRSLVEDDKLATAQEIVKNFGDKIVLPKDHLVALDFNELAQSDYTDNQLIDQERVAIDIGWNTISTFKEHIQQAQSILWNGPMGVFEWEHAAIGTREIVQAIVANSSAFKLAGGGDSIAALNKLGVSGFDHVSTGGGAMLAYLAYESFPTLEVILKQNF